MANAKQCDRCGVLYSRKEANIFEDLVKQVCGIPPNQLLHEMIHPYVDLCPKCTESLEKWFEDGGE